MAATSPAPYLAPDEVVDLGDERGLVAVLTRAGAAATGRPAVIFLNAGVLHRIGPHRLHVRLARRLAARGLAALRLDLGGVGDSPSLGDAVSFRDSAVADTRAAMTAMTRATGAERFVLFGLCSGADNSVATALADPRVVGVVALDPPTYANRRARARKLVRRVIALGGPVAAARWATTVIQRRLGRRMGGASDDGQRREVASVEDHGAQLATLADRGIAVLAIYTGCHDDRYNHPDQLFEHYPGLRGRVERAFFPDANHSFAELAAQAALGDLVTTWLERHFR